VGEVPPLVGVAVNVTPVPGHIVVCEAEILTEGTTDVVTEIGIALLVAVVVEAHASLLVTTAEIIAPFVKVEVENVEAVAPVILIPLSFH
jgi:hypothetical protein